jgi:hypothetical protein
MVRSSYVDDGIRAPYILYDCTTCNSIVIAMHNKLDEELYRGFIIELVVHYDKKSPEELLEYFRNGKI